jgi:hypothetical protein
LPLFARYLAFYCGLSYIKRGMSKSSRPLPDEPDVQTRPARRMFGREIDGRTRASRALRDLVQEIAAATGRPFALLTAITRSRCRRAAALMTQLELFEAEIAAGRRIDGHFYVSLIDRLDRCLDGLNLVDSGVHGPVAQRLHRLGQASPPKQGEMSEDELAKTKQTLLDQLARAEAECATERESDCKKKRSS